MKRGDVLYWKNFKYRDGGTPSHKLMLVAGIDKYGDALLLKTTSRDGGYRPDPDGCHADDSVFRFKSNPKPFDEPTWVLYEDSYTRAINEIQAQGVNVCFSLTEEQMSAITNCLRRSQEYARYLEDYLK